MTYFTRFPVNVTRRQSRSMLANPYLIHATLAASFPLSGQAASSGSRILWRLDRQAGGSTLLYVVSPEKPSLVGLDEQIGFPDLEPQWVTREYEPFLNRIENGQKYHFRLVANPVVKKRPVEGGARKLIPHLTLLQQAAWLAGKAAYIGTGVEVPEHFAREEVSRAERHGFRICHNEPNGEISLVVSNSNKQSFKKTSGDTVTMATAQYDGLLEVANADKLRSALVGGIGRAKSFGCGLLTLVPYGG